MRRLQSGDHALGAGEQAKGVERLLVGSSGVFSPFGIGQCRVLGAEHGVVQSGGDGMRGRNLPVRILQHVGVCTLQNTRRSAAEASSMVDKALAAAARLHADQLHPFVLDELVEDPDSVRASSHAGDDGLGHLAFSFQNLRAGLAADDGMKVTDHGGIGMSAQNTAQQVVGGADVGHPVTHGLIDSIFEGLRAGFHAAHLRAQQTHAEDVEFLAPHVFHAHVNHALVAEERADCGRGHAVLPGAGFSDDPALAHAPRQQRLPQAVVDLVRAGVQQVFALEINPGAAQRLGQALGVEERRGTAGVFLEKPLELGAELLVAARLLVLTLQFFQSRHQGLRDIAAAVRTEASWLFLHFPYCTGAHDCSAFRTALTNAFSFVGSLWPGSRSIPVTTSTPHGENVRIASPTFPGVRPPAMISLPWRSPICALAACQSKGWPLPAPESSNQASTASAAASAVATLAMPFPITMVLMIRSELRFPGRAWRTSAATSLPCNWIPVRSTRPATRRISSGDAFKKTPTRSTVGGSCLMMP